MNASRYSSLFVSLPLIRMKIQSKIDEVIRILLTSKERKNLAFPASSERSSFSPKVTEGRWSESVLPSVVPALSLLALRLIAPRAARNNEGRLPILAPSPPRPPPREEDMAAEDEDEETIESFRGL